MGEMWLLLSKEENDERDTDRLVHDLIKLPDGVCWHEGLCVHFGLEEWLVVDRVIVDCAGETRVWFNKECYPENSLAEEVKIFCDAGWKKR